jgi:hypothetical protein
MGSTGICPRFKNEFDVLDIGIPGPGPNKQPDSAWRPRKRFDLNSPLAALFPQQPNGDPFPTLVLEVGNSQPMSDLLKIRDRVLSSRTLVNLFVFGCFWPKHYLGSRFMVSAGLPPRPPRSAPPAWPTISSKYHLVRNSENGFTLCKSPNPPRRPSPTLRHRCYWSLSFRGRSQSPSSVTDLFSHWRGGNPRLHYGKPAPLIR